MKKRYISILMTLIITLLLSGCGESEKELIVDSECNTGKEFNCTIDDFMGVFEEKLADKFGKSSASGWVRTKEQLTLNGTSDNNGIELDFYQADAYYNTSTANVISAFGIYENSDTNNIFEIMYQINVAELNDLSEAAQQNYKYNLPACVIASLGYEPDEILKLMKQAEANITDENIGEVFSDELIVQCGYTRTSSDAQVLVYIVFPCSEEYYEEQAGETSQSDESE